MSNKLKLTTIKLETKDGKEVELSLAEAKDLHDQLHELFGTKYVPSVPIVIERDRYPWLPYWAHTTEPYGVSMTWCGSSCSSGLKLAMGGEAV